MKKSSPKKRVTSRCKQCSEPATKSIVWAGGRAAVNVCSDHVEVVMSRLRLQPHSEIVGVRRVRK